MTTKNRLAKNYVVLTSACVHKPSLPAQLDCTVQCTVYLYCTVLFTLQASSVGGICLDERHCRFLSGTTCRPEPGSDVRTCQCRPRMAPDAPNPVSGVVPRCLREEQQGQEEEEEVEEVEEVVVDAPQQGGTVSRKHLRICMIARLLVFSIMFALPL